MITKIFAVFDSKAACFYTPQFYSTSGLAERAFTNAVNAKEGEFGAHPEDFTLFEIGEYDDASAKITNHAAPISVVTAITVKRVE